MAHYLWLREKCTPNCVICGRIMPYCGIDDIKIDPKEVRHCYFCGSSMDLFTYPKGDKTE